MGEEQEERSNYMRKHPKRLISAGITPARYQELQAICRQYPAYKRDIRRAHAGIVDRPVRRSGAWKRPDPTGNVAAALADNLSWINARVRLIEHCAERSAPHSVARAILKSVTEGRSYDLLCPPCGKRQFFEHRLWFFVLLDEALRGYEKG